MWLRENPYYTILSTNQWASGTDESNYHQHAEMSTNSKSTKSSETGYPHITLCLADTRDYP